MDAAIFSALPLLIIYAYANLMGWIDFFARYGLRPSAATCTNRLPREPDFP